MQRCPFLAVFFLWITLLGTTVLGDANFPTTPDGRTYHLEVKQGDVANRVLTVGDLGRARNYAAMYFENSTIRSILSERGFLTITGFYKGVEISIIGTGMGTPMMDFMVRETRVMVDGPMAYIRVGTCGSPSANVSLGDIVVVKESVYVQRNSDQFNYPVTGVPYYTRSRPVPADADLSYSLHSFLSNEVEDKSEVHLGGDVTTDSFYSSQGRILNDFIDHNENVISDVMPENTLSIQMESFHLLDLALSSRPDRRLIAAANCLVIAQRFTDKFIDDDLKREREVLLGKAALEALVAVKL